MNIQISMNEAMEPAPASIESISSKSTSGTSTSSDDSDSLEYSNDDHSEQRRKLMVQNSKPDYDVANRPPKHPGYEPSDSVLNSNLNSNHYTPKRTTKSPGPLYLFSPGLSPIGHTIGGNFYDDDGVDNMVDENRRMLEVAQDGDGGNQAAASTGAPTVEGQDDDINLNDSMDSLDISTRLENNEGKPTDRVRVSADQQKGGLHDSPNYRYWKNKLFGDDNDNDHDIDSEPVEDSFLSVDSDMNITKQTLIYPTTDTVYNRSEMSLRSNNNSFDSDMNVTKQSLVYPTTAALYERSEASQHIDSLNNSVDSDMHVMKQSLVFPATSSDPWQQRSTNSPKSRRTAYGAEEGELSKQSFILPMSPATPHNTTANLSHLSLLNTSANNSGYLSAGEGPMGRSLQSISLLPASPVMSATGHGHKQMQQPAGHGRIPIFPQTQSPKASSAGQHGSASGHASYAGNGGVDTGASAGANVGPSRTSLDHRANSDTEYVTSASKRRSAELRQQLQLAQWRDTSDVNLLSRGSAGEPSRPKTKETQRATQPVPAAAVTPTATQISRTAWGNHVHGDSSAGEKSFQHTAAETPQQHRTPQPAAAMGSLVVGALYTLMVDSQGRPAFVPVLADQLVGPSRPIAGADTSHYSGRRNQEFSRQTFQETRTTSIEHEHATPSVFIRQVSPSRGTPIPINVQRDPYESNFSPASPELQQQQGPFSPSLDIDLREVLHRALYEGSLSAEKTKRWRERDTGASSYFPPSSSSTGSATAAASSSPVYKKATQYAHMHVSAAVPRHQPVTPSAGSHRYSATPLSPAFNVGLGTDGGEQLLPPASYWKERLQQRDLTSFYHATFTGAAFTLQARTPNKLDNYSYTYNVHAT